MRHAIMILAHGNMEVVEKTLSIMDDYRFDFYIHVDKKSKGDFSYLVKLCKHSTVSLTERLPIYWGDSNMLLAHLNLMKAASAKNYDYYHMISGSDLPLVTPDEFCEYFEQAKGKEFIHQWGKDEADDKRIQWRCHYRYPFLRYLNRARSPLVVKLEKLLFMRILRIPRKNVFPASFRLYVSEDWYSFTGKFVEYILKNTELLYKNFLGGIHVAEVAFISLLLNNPEFAPSHSDEYTRYIDWVRGNPYIWKKSDYNELIHAPGVFARKFSPETDRMIIQMLTDRLMIRKAEQM